MILSRKIDLKKTTKNAVQEIEAYNGKQPVQEISYKTKRGFNVVRYQPTNQLRQSEKDTIKQIVYYLAIQQLKGRTKTNKIRVTCNYLAKLCGCCVKTVYNHIMKLIKAGFLKAKRKTTEYFANNPYHTPCLELELSESLIILEAQDIPKAGFIVDKAGENPLIKGVQPLKKLLDSVFQKT